MENIIIKELITKSVWETASSLASKLSISDRTVKKYIKDINNQHKDLITSSNKGYFIEDKSQALKILSVDEDLIPKDYEERKNRFLGGIIIDKKNRNLDLVATEFGISRGTLSNEISKIRVELLDFNLKLVTKDNRAYIHGSEENIRKLASHIVNQESESNIISIKSIKKFFPEYDIEAFKNIVRKNIEGHNLFVNDIAFVNIVLHLVITAQRAEQNKICSLHSKRSDSTVYKLTVNIAKELKESMDINLNDKDIYDMHLMILSRVTKQDLRSLAFEHIYNEVSTQTTDIIKQILSGISMNFGINLSSDSFLTRFTLHIDNLLLRIKNNIQMRNPQTNTIKNSFPFMYDISVLIANVIKNNIGTSPTEDEIAYITLHISVLAEENKREEESLKVLVLFPSYVQNFYDNLHVIQSAFRNDVTVVDYITNEKDISKYKGIDLIVSTTDLCEDSDVPFVKISPQLNRSDINRLSIRIENIVRNTMKENIENKLRYLFSEELFFYDNDFNNETEELNFLIDNLIECEKVDSNFREKIFERELISASAFSNIALPHPIEMIAKESSIAVSIHPTKIAWGENNEVNIIMLLAINEKDKLLFKDIFDFVTEIIMDHTHFSNIIKLNSYQDFIDYLLNETYI